MTKKQFAITAAVELGLPEFSTIRRVIDAIIDALPEEPTSLDPMYCPKCRVFTTHCECVPRVDLSGGPEPVEVKESQPTSELIGACEKMLLGHWNLYKSHFGEGSNPDNDIVRRELIQAMSGVDSSILGPQQPPAATSGATQLPTYEEAIAANSAEASRRATEDARKLRIMKAMEEIARDRNDARFICDDGVWHFWGPIGVQKINDYYSPDLAHPPPDSMRITGNSPEEPHKCGAQREEEAIAARAEAEKLWEDEIWVNPGSGQVRQQERGDCEKDYHYSGWRRIKVKEVR